MSQSYTKDCVFCGKKIRISDELGKWKPFRHALDKKDRKVFDDMLSIPRLYTISGSYS
jgi:hypothetical protein